MTVRFDWSSNNALVTKTYQVGPDPIHHPSRLVKEAERLAVASVGRLKMQAVKVDRRPVESGWCASLEPAHGEVEAAKRFGERGRRRRLVDATSRIGLHSEVEPEGIAIVRSVGVEQTCGDTACGK